MCLSVPGQVLTIAGEAPYARCARVDFGGVLREVNLALLPEVGVGDWILVHAGVGISRLTADTAHATIEAWCDLASRAAGDIEPDTDHAG